MVAMYLTFAILRVRIDSSDVFYSVCIWDFILGFMFAASYLICKISKHFVESKSSKHVFKNKKTLLIFICIWFLTTTPLVLYHDSCRFTISKSGSTRSYIYIVENGLYSYKKDCGIYPTVEQGLNALWINPGVNNWDGPYVKYESLLEDSVVLQSELDIS